MKKVAVILAAGLGSRLMPLTESEHKCMTKVCGVPIIYNALKNLEDCGIDEAIVVVGYLREKLKEQISRFNFKLNIIFAENDIYNQTNTIFSLQKGMAKLSKYDELYIIEGDVFFDSSVLHRLIDSEWDNATVLESYNEKLEGTFVELGKSGCVIDWRHKSDQDDGYVLEDKYKTVNLHKFSNKFVKEYLISALDDTTHELGLKTPIEKAMRRIVNSNVNAIKGEVLNGEKWFEIDDINDLKVAEKIFGGI